MTQPLARIVLRRQRKKRLEQGHPWVYQSEAEPTFQSLEPGQIVDIVNHQGVFLARGFVNPTSQIVARVLTYDRDQPIDAALFLTRIQAAWAYRQRFLTDTTACRAVYGEADFLPGLIVDKYGDYLVVQILAYGMEVQKDAILAALNTVFAPKGILLRNDVSVRKLEGLTEAVEVWQGTVPRELYVEEHGLTFCVDVHEGQKTGYFFDQRDNRTAIAPLMTGWGNKQIGATVLECFCHTGSFTAHALQYGAKHITAVDISETAIAMAEKNLAHNGLSDRATFQVANAFDYLREAEQRRDEYDVVMLDPPAFAKSKRQLEGAYRGYKEINLRGMKLVRDGGYLVTASCSYHMTPDLFGAMIADAALDAHCVLRLVHFAGAAKDHPEIVGADEGHYLKFAIYEVHHRS